MAWRHILACLLLGVALHSASAATFNYTVDDDKIEFPGADYTNIQAAVDACDGDANIDTITVYDGIYTQAIDLKDYLTLQAAAGANPIINISSAEPIIDLLTSPYSNTVDGFTIDGNNVATRGITHSNDSHISYLTIKNCTIKNINGPGIYFYLRQYTMTGSSITNCTIKDVSSDGLYIYFDNGKIESSTFLGNRIYNCGGVGFFFDRYNGTRPQCSGNVIENNLFVNNTNNWGCRLYQCNAVGVSVINNTISGNKDGFYGRSNGDSKIKGTIIYGNSGTDTDQTGYQISFSDYPGASGFGNIDSDPLFVVTNNPVSSNFYRLSGATPCVSPYNGYTEMGYYGRKVLVIGDDSGYCTNLTVTLSLKGSAPTWTNSAINMKLSNDGSKWYTNSFSVSPAWDLSDSAYGGNSNLGFKTVFYQPLDTSSNALPGSTVVSNRAEYLGTTPTIAILPGPAQYFTVQSAIDASTNSGDVIEIQSSFTYNINEEITLKDNRTLRAETNETPVIRASSAAPIISLPLTPSSITIDGLTLDGNSLAVRGIVSPNNNAVTDVHIKNCTIKDINGEGIRFYPQGASMTSSSVTNCTISGCSDAGIYVYFDNGRLESCTFEANRVYDCNGVGLDLYRYNSARPACSGNVIKNNLLVNNTNSWGCRTFACDFVGVTFENNTVSGNKYGYYSRVYAGSTIKASVMYGNGSSDLDQTGNSISASDYPGGSPAEGNMDTDPLFLETNNPALPNFYRLNATSPCISPGRGYTESGYYGRKVLTIGDDSGYCTNLTVALSLKDNAPTWTNAAINMKLSSDGLKWYTNSFSASPAWDLSDVAYGGDGNLGFKKVFYQPLDASSNSLSGSTVVSNSVEYLGTTPTIAILTNAAQYFTIQDAIDASTNSGDIIELQSSQTYDIDVQISLINNRVLRAKEGETPVIRSRTSMNALLYLPTTPNSITIDGLILDGNSNTTYGITAPIHQAIDGLTVTNCVIRNTTGPGFYLKLDWGLLENFLFARNKIYNCGGRGFYLLRHNPARPACSNNVFRNNLIVNNINDWGYYAGNCQRITFSYVNNTISGNGNGSFNSDTNSTMKNGIIYDNLGTELTFPGDTAKITYCDIKGFSAAGTNGNIDASPAFVDPANIDFHLKSKGFALVGGTTWTPFPVDSPCLDTGDPASPFDNEPRNNGNRVNMGAYGNTEEASRTIAAGTVITVR